MAEISAGWISISVTSHGRTNAGQLRAYGRIDHARSHFDDETAEQAGIDLCLKARITAELGLQGGLEVGRLGIRKRARRSRSPELRRAAARPGVRRNE